MDERDVSGDEHRRAMMPLQQQVQEQASRLAAQQADPTLRTMAAGDWGGAEEWFHEQQENAMEHERAQAFPLEQARQAQGR
jgi:hypothetical protein